MCEVMHIPSDVLGCLSLDKQGIHRTIVHTYSWAFILYRTLETSVHVHGKDASARL